MRLKNILRGGKCMCGIIGYVGNEDAVHIIIDGLKKLEYRGYDSAGISVYGESGIRTAKQKGRLAALETHPDITSLKGKLGVGHTRWATHGEPSDINSHPHIGNQNKIVVVHNGIIENYAQIKQELEDAGIVFKSQTDSEVVAQLAEYYHKGDIKETVLKVVDRLRGSYALGILFEDAPETLVAVKKDNPLIVGVSGRGNFIASDVPAILKHTKQVYYMGDNEIAILKGDSVRFFDIAGNNIEKNIEVINWTADSAEKDGYPHFMLKEIYEQPRVLRDTLSAVGYNENCKKALSAINVTRFNKIVITACGSAYHAGFAGKYVFESLCRFPAIDVELASEFRYKDPVTDKNTLVILISQSGETADTIAALREAKKRGAFTLSIVNVVGSTVAKEADYCLYTAAGPEISVATTKAFSAQLMTLYILAIRFASDLGKLTAADEQKLIDELAAMPAKVEEILTQSNSIKQYVSTCLEQRNIFFIGRNIDYAIALEGSLKLKEITYLSAEAHAGGELKHGSISLVDEDTLVIAISNRAFLYDKIMNNVEQVISRGAKVLLLGNCPQAKSEEKMTHIKLPEIYEFFSPSLSVAALQLFSYHMAAYMKLDIDKPRNLAKSVTVE